MNALNLPLEFKSIADSGRFDGHAAVFGNVDLGGDVIERGAFKEFALNAEGRLTVLWQHKQSQPIGTASVEEDAKGLRVVGDLVLDDPMARAAHAHMKAGSARGMSIGYDLLAGGARRLPSGVRQLSALKVWEASIVSFPMNPEAGVTHVKERPADIRSFERALREIGFSQKAATAIALHGWKQGNEQPDETGFSDNDVAAIAAALRNLKLSLSKR